MNIQDALRSVHFGWQHIVIAAIVTICIVILIGYILPSMTDRPGIIELSKEYWSQEARPFAIIEHSKTGSTLTVVLQNMEKEPRILENGTFYDYKNGVTGNLNISASNRLFQAGEMHNYKLTFSESCAISPTYGYIINFTFSDVNQPKTLQKQYGIKTLIGRCT